MPIKVELHRDVVWFLKTRCNAQEVDAFYEGLDKIRTAPLENSEPTADPRLSRYMLRFFRFRWNLAIFRYDPAESRIRVLQCRKVPPRQRGRQAKGLGEG